MEKKKVAVKEKVETRAEIQVGIKAARGLEMTCKSWQTEGAMRMLMNNLDPEVAEKPADLIVYGGAGKAARNWEAYHLIIKCLEALENDETLLIQSGKPVGIFRTHEDAPRVLISNAMLVPNWGNWEKFRELEELGLTMYGQMTAGSWIYIGTQGIVQGTYETFAAAGKKHFGKSLKGRLILSAGLGGMGGAQPLAVTMNEGVFLGVEMDPSRIKRRMETGYLDVMTDRLEDALILALGAREKGVAKSIGLLGNAAEIHPELIRRGIVPDLVTDQTSAHDPLNGYFPVGLNLHEALELRREDPDEYIRRSMESMAIHVRAMLEFQKKGSIVFDYGNNLRAQAYKAGVQDAFDYPGFVPAYIRPLFCEGKGPFRWVALSGDPEDIYKTDDAILKEFPEDVSLARWIRLAKEKVKFHGVAGKDLLVRLWPEGKGREIVQRHGGQEKAERTHRDRKGPYGQRVCGFSLSRDRRNEGWKRRDCGLAHSQRPSQYRNRSELGLGPPWRRSWNRLFHPRRHGHRCRWNEKGGEKDIEGSDGGPGHRCDAPYGRWL